MSLMAEGMQALCTLCLWQQLHLIILFRCCKRGTNAVRTRTLQSLGCLQKAAVQVVCPPT